MKLLKAIDSLDAKLQSLSEAVQALVAERNDLRAMVDRLIRLRNTGQFAPQLCDFCKGWMPGEGFGGKGPRHPVGDCPIARYAPWLDTVEGRVAEGRERSAKSKRKKESSK